jgi:hypothetical protein
MEVRKQYSRVHLSAQDNLHGDGMHFGDGGRVESWETGCNRYASGDTPSHTSCGTPLDTLSHCHSQSHTVTRTVTLPCRSCGTPLVTLSHRHSHTVTLPCRSCGTLWSHCHTVTHTDVTFFCRSCGTPWFSQMRAWPCRWPQLPLQGAPQPSLTPRKHCRCVNPNFCISASEVPELPNLIILYGLE